MNIGELGLTPQQLGEVQELSEELVSAWLAATVAAGGLRSPAGWFLSGVRSGTYPGAVPDNARIQAERYVRRVGYLHQTEDELRDELASRKWPIDDRLVELWRQVRPLGEQVEREQLERAERWKQAHAAMQDLGTGLSTEPAGNTTTAETAQPSQTSVPLTRVSARSSTSDDVDIDWAAA